MSMKNKEESRKTKGVDREWSEKCRDWGSKNPRKPETLEKAYKNHPPGGPETPDPRWRGNSNQKNKQILRTTRKHPAGEQQDRSGNQTANPLVNEALRDKQQRKKTYNAKNKKEKKKREQKKKINNHKNKKILRTTSNNRQANNKIEVQNRLWIPL